ncbi:hypothetical protein HCH52_00395 [Oscillospiraceae bacterium HV4-5-C5C]|nr:hypothetical protein [Oscillospiraceae bacterium HV4-5-C5C]
MKTTKLIIGIVSLVLTVVVLFQSCAATVGEALEADGSSGGAAGVFVAIMMLIAGIVLLAARQSRGGSIFAFILYLLAGITGLAAHGNYTDLLIWGGLCLLFALLILMDVLTGKKRAAAAQDKTEQLPH